MSKISFEQKKDKLIITNKLTYPEAVNDRILHALRSGVVEGFLPVEMKTKRKDTLVECTVSGLMPLTQYFSGTVSKKKFLDTVLDVVRLVKSCEKNMINPNNLDLEADRIFIDPYTKAVSCLYWPLVNNQNERPPHFFFGKLTAGIDFCRQEDCSYLEEYLAYFRRPEPFSVNGFEKMIKNLLGMQSQKSFSPSERIDMRDNHADPEAKPSAVSMEYDPFAEQTPVPSGGEIRCPLCHAVNAETANFCLNCGNSLVKKPAEPPKTEVEPPQKNVGMHIGTSVLGNHGDGTTVLGYDEPEHAASPCLERKKTGEKIWINAPAFRIGKDADRCDGCISDNPAVSRCHADIITRDNRYYIIDLHSTNRTYLDGRLIPMGEEIEIFPNTDIRLANEDFTFYIE